MRLDRRTFAGFILSGALLASAATVRAQGSVDDFVLDVANDHSTKVRQALAAGRSPDTRDANGDPVLLIAARGGNLATVDTLLAGRARVDLGNRFDDTAMMVAALNGQLEIVRKLRAYGAAVNRPGWTPLIYAATGGHDELVRFFLAQGADINAASANGITALMMAVREGKESTVDLLLQRGARLDRKDAVGATALDWARRKDDAAMVERLRRAGARS